MAELFKKKKLKQADTTSSLTQNLRKKESKSKLASKTSLRESAEGQPTGGSFKVVVIQEGLGNLGDCSYYSREALEQAVSAKVFEGKKIFADHPSVIEEQTRPERSVRDIIGYLRNVQLDNSGDRVQVIAEAQIIDTEHTAWAKQFMSEAISFSQTFDGNEFVGLSINATGDADPMSVDEFTRSVNIPNSAMPKIQSAIDTGIQTINNVRAISDVFSVDLVTEAGAGGKILALIENSKGRKTMSKESEKKENEKKEMDKQEAEAKEAKHEEKKESDGEKKEGEEKPVVDQNKSVMDGDEAKQADEPAVSDHPDEQQDIDLIKKMLDKYLGKPEHDESLMKSAKEAYEACMKAGMEGKEALDSVGHSLKVARAMSGNQPSLPKAEADSKEGSMEKKETIHNPQAKESAKTKELSDKVKLLEGELAALKEKNKVMEAEKFLEQKLSESGLPRAVTKTFREGLKIKSKDQVEEELKKFLEGYRKGQGQVALDYDAIVNPERTEMGNIEDSGFNYDACLED